MVRKNQNQDERYMEMVLDLAKKAQNPGPNPYVGAILVKNNKIVGRGFHHNFGEAHAEVNAINDAGNKTSGSTLYINLEPCCHYGKTPPCTRALINAGVKEVVIGMKDPNLLVNGKGIKYLMGKGVRVKTGILKEECKRLNEVYIKYIIKQIPFVVLKSAMSIDGKIATSTGESKWITSEKSRSYVHRLRGKVDAILVGINTVLKDNPELKISSASRCHIGALSRGQASALQLSNKPYKIIVDSRLRIPLEARVLKSPEQVILATTKRAPDIKIKRLQDLGVRVLVVKEKKGRVDLNILMKELAKMEISSVLIEGGGEINASAIESGIVDKILFFIAPKVIGGRNAITPVEGEGIKRIARAIPIRNITVSQIGGDVVIEGYINSR